MSKIDASKDGENSTSSASENAENSAESFVHFLTSCNIDYDGPAAVSSYFQVSSLKGSDRTSESHFRGRRLLGKSVDLERQNLGGIYVHPASGNKLIVDGRFTSLTVWKHEENPSSADFEDALRWFEIADSVSISTCLLLFSPSFCSL